MPHGLLLLHRLPVIDAAKEMTGECGAACRVMDHIIRRHQIAAYGELRVILADGSCGSSDTEGKHEWHQACFIPSASDRLQVERHAAYEGVPPLLPGWGARSWLRPPVEQFATVARSVKSRFFTMDVAKREEGEWMIVELGDGQVSGLPDRPDVMQFYRRLKERTCAGEIGD